MTRSEQAIEPLKVASDRKKWLDSLPDGVPCDHVGCLSHVTHPCEDCGRIAGKRIVDDNEYRGKCPVCSGQLEQVAGMLQCSDHFSIDQAVFERLWDAYEASPQSVKDGETLLELLIKATDYPRSK